MTTSTGVDRRSGEEQLLSVNAVDCEDFARLFWKRWFIQPVPMNLMSENIETLPKGIVGMSMQLRHGAQLELPENFLRLAKTFETVCSDCAAFDFSLLSSVGPPLGVFSTFHGHFVEGKIEKFLMGLSRKPSSKPPNSIEKQSGSMGGYPHGFFKVISALAELELKVEATMRGFILEPTLWPLKFERTKDLNILPLKLLQNRLFIEHPEGLVKLKFIPDHDGFEFEVSSSLDLKLETSCFETASRRLWAILEPVFEKNAQLELNDKPNVIEHSQSA